MTNANDLIGEFDAEKWADGFQSIVLDGGLTIDRELMLGWFANAIMAGFDYARTHPVETADPDSQESPESKPFAFTYTDGQGSPCDNPDEGDLTLHGAVSQALGYTSMCWVPRPSGVFDSSAAAQAGDALIAYIEDML